MISLEEARFYCANKHGNQKYGENLYSYHLDKVEQVARRFGFTNECYLIACWGHDLIEDTGTSIEELKEEDFPPLSIKLIAAVTDAPGRNRKERKRNTYPQIKATPGAILLKLFDRIANVEECIETKNRNLFFMYMYEQAEFDIALREHDEESEPMWNHLDDLFTSGLRIFNEDL